MNRKLKPGTLNRLWADPNSWRAQVIYVCKDDPRVIVPKRVKWSGWTLNFAHVSAWFALLAVVAAIVFPTLALLSAGLVGTWVWYAFLIGLVAAICVLSAVLASPRRYEDAR